MSAGRSRTHRDDRRRKLGQNFLVDPAETRRLIAAAHVEPGELIVEVGAGRGDITVPIARKGGRVMAIEPDPSWAATLRSRANELDCCGEIEVVEDDFRQLPLPEEPYRVISSPPFGLTTALLSHLLDRPSAGPWRADLLIQHEVARKRAATPPTTLRSAAWAPWWEFELGPVIPATSFRPIPRVDAAILTIRRRQPPVLPDWLAPDLRELLRPGWQPPPN